MPHKDPEETRLYAQTRRATGKGAAADARYYLKRPSRVGYRDKRAPARDRAEKYGLTLREIERIGLDLYPDVREALDGSSDT